MTYLYLALGLVALLVLVGLLLSSRYSFVRKTTIAAPPAAVHSYVGFLDKWPEWMPWELESPSIITTRSEQTTGVGASQSWTSSKAGNGEILFTECEEDTGIAYDLTFITKGKRAPAQCSIRYTPTKDGTEVAWAMQGDLADMMPPVLRGLMRPMVSTMMAKNCTKGLAGLKEKVEAM